MPSYRNKTSVDRYCALDDEWKDIYEMKTVILMTCRMTAVYFRAEYFYFIRVVDLLIFFFVRVRVTNK